MNPCATMRYNTIGAVSLTQHCELKFECLFAVVSVSSMPLRVHVRTSYCMLVFYFPLSIAEQHSDKAKPIWYGRIVLALKTHMHRNRMRVCECVCLILF